MVFKEDTLEAHLMGRKQGCLSDKKRAHKDNFCVLSCEITSSLLFSNSTGSRF